MALVICDECGKEFSDQAAACPNCGAPSLYYVHPPSISVIPNRSGKNRSIAVLLALLLGGLGVHKFYLEKPGIGVLYFLFCWTWIPMILGLFEGIGYLLMSDEDFQKKHG